MAVVEIYSFMGYRYSHDWQAVGYYMVMYLAGIDGIPKELYEAASMDGANVVEQFFENYGTNAMGNHSNYNHL